MTGHVAYAGEQKCSGADAIESVAVLAEVPQHVTGHEVRQMQIVNFGSSEIAGSDTVDQGDNEGHVQDDSVERVAHDIDAR